MKMENKMKEIKKRKKRKKERRRKERDKGEGEKVTPRVSQAVLKRED